MVEHQPRLLGSRVRFPAGAFAIFSVSAKASLPISLSLFPFLFLSFFLILFLSFPLPLPSTLRLRIKISLFAFIPLRPAGGDPGLDHLQKYFFDSLCFLEWTWPF